MFKVRTFHKQTHFLSSFVYISYPTPRKKKKKALPDIIQERELNFCLFRANKKQLISRTITCEPDLSTIMDLMLVTKQLLDFKVSWIA